MSSATRERARSPTLALITNVLLATDREHAAVPKGATVRRATGDYDTTTGSGQAVRAFVPFAPPPRERRDRTFAYNAYLRRLREGTELDGG